jgi:heme/copper-type cytochrome/quinol oxidase subunit 2
LVIKQSRWDSTEETPDRLRVPKLDKFGNVVYDEDGNIVTIPVPPTFLTSQSSLLLKELSEDDLYDENVDYTLVRTYKKRNVSNQNSISKRLLRTKRLLVLPTNINMTLITNSFDVVHSWYIPGLGIKMDCIPGRSTHHTLFIDNAGFYYGQCAEICGRFHHHMPIRVCALPFEHFIIWWHYYGLPYFLNIEEVDRDLHHSETIRTHSW